jgi:hypothetical protein
MDGWPELDELKQVLDVESNDWDGLPGSGDDAESRLSALLSAAIAYVKFLVGDWDEYIDLPDTNLNRAALRAAELMALKPEVAAMVASGKSIGDPTFGMFMVGHRRKWGIA